jgi:periplasmic protein TonB
MAGSKRHHEAKMVRENKTSARPLFATLLASRPPRHSRARRASLIASIIGHTALVVAAVWLTRETSVSTVGGDRSAYTIIVNDTWTPLRNPVTASKPKVAKGPSRVRARRPAARKTATARTEPPAPVPPPKPELPDPPVVQRADLAPLVPVDFDRMRREIDNMTAKIGDALNAELAKPPTPVVPNASAANGAATNGSASNGPASNGLAANGPSGNGDAVDSEPSIDELRASGPRITPYSVAPLLLNRAEIAGILRARYPEDLRMRGLGGLTTLWLLIDKNGKARKAIVQRSSGRDAFDALAIEVVPKMRFQAAINHGKAANVWVQLPVRFQVVEHLGW